jgi:hypothetical protein
MLTPKYEKVQLVILGYLILNLKRIRLTDSILFRWMIVVWPSTKTNGHGHGHAENTVQLGPSPSQKNKTSFLDQSRRFQGVRPNKITYGQTVASCLHPYT